MNPEALTKIAQFQRSGAFGADLAVFLKSSPREGNKSITKSGETGSDNRADICPRCPCVISSIDRECNRREIDLRWGGSSQ